MHRRKILRISNDENNVPARIIKKAFCLLFVDMAVISHVEEGGTIPHILIMPTVKGFASDI